MADTDAAEHLSLTPQGLRDLLLELESYEDTRAQRIEMHIFGSVLIQVMQEANEIKHALSDIAKAMTEMNDRERRVSQPMIR